MVYKIKSKIITKSGIGIIKVINSDATNNMPYTKNKNNDRSTNRDILNTSFLI